VRTTGHRTSRSLSIVVLAAGVLLLLLLAAAPALAADGVQVIAPGSDADMLSQGNADVSGGFMAYAQTTVPPSDDAVICLKSLLDDAPPWQISRPSGFKDSQPRILYEGATHTIWVVWTRLMLSDPWDTDIWLWKGTYNPNPNGYFTPANDGYPKLLVSGTTGAGAPTISNQFDPSIGLVHEADGSHVVVAWEDGRDNGYAAPLVYSMDLTADTSYDAIDWASSDGPGMAGNYLDYAPVQSRGQYAPDVGYTGVYWLDERWSFPTSDWNLKDTAVWRADLVNGTAGPFFSETVHANDNGLANGNEGGPRVTGSGAAWLRCGPYANHEAYEPVSRAVGGRAHVFAPIVGPDHADTWYQPGQSSTVFAMMGAHANNARAIDYDVFFYDPATLQTVPVCDIGWAPGTDPDSVPYYYTKEQGDPAIGPASGGYRVVWSDNRGSAPGDDSTADSRLYEAFVPTVTIKAATSLRFGKSTTVSATVAPSFAGQKVRLELVKASARYGTTVYTTVRSKYSTEKVLSSHSSATWTLKPATKGTYLARVRFLGGTRYAFDGVTVATGNMTAVPHVPNDSKVVKIVVR
jgi:hypothetical protein